VSASASVAGNNNGTASLSPSNTQATTGNTSKSGDNNQVAVQRSISASASKPRRSSTGAENNGQTGSAATPPTVTTVITGVTSDLESEAPPIPPKSIVAQSETEADDLADGGTFIRLITSVCVQPYLKFFLEVQLIYIDPNI